MDRLHVGGRPCILLGSSARWDEEGDSDEQDTTEHRCFHSIRAIAVRGYDVRMRIMRLFWAGVQIESEGATLVIDLLEHTAPIRSLMGDPRLPLAFAAQVLDAALVTHL